MKESCLEFNKLQAQRANKNSIFAEQAFFLHDNTQLC